MSTLFVNTDLKSTIIHTLMLMIFSISVCFLFHYLIHGLLQISALFLNTELKSHHSFTHSCIPSSPGRSFKFFSHKSECKIMQACIHQCHHTCYTKSIIHTRICTKNEHVIALHFVYYSSLPWYSGDMTNIGTPSFSCLWHLCLADFNPGTAEWLECASYFQVKYLSWRKHCLKKKEIESHTIDIPFGMWCFRHLHVLYHGIMRWGGHLFSSSPFLHRQFPVEFR